MSQRDEIAQVIRTTLWGEVSRDATLVADKIADALLAAGLIVPPDATKYALSREEAARVLKWSERADDDDFWEDADSALYRRLTAFFSSRADFLDTQETPRGEVVN